MQHREDADGAAKIVRIGGERLHRLRRRLHQRPQQHALMRTHDRAHLGGQCEHPMEVGHREQLRLARGEPRARSHAVTRRTTAIAARVVDIVLDTAGIARRDVAPQGGSATGREIVERTLMAHRHRGAKARRIRRPELPHDRRDGHDAPGDAPGRYTVAIRVFTVACSALVTIGVIGVYTAVVAGR